MTHLAPVVAMLRDIEKDALRRLTAAHHALQKPTMLAGISREYQPAVEGGEQLPPEYGRVQATVREMVEETRAALLRLFDVTAARDFTNASGSVVADVVVNGRVLIEAAPVPYLLWLEKRLDDLTTFVRKLPTHDPATDWTLEDPQRGTYKATAVKTARVVQVPQARVIVPGDQYHPAQVQPYTESVMTGIWTKVDLTGGIPVSEQAAMLERIQALMRAVHVAREEANRVDADEPAPGARILEYVFG